MDTFFTSGPIVPAPNMPWASPMVRTSSSIGLIGAAKLQLMARTLGFSAPQALEIFSVLGHNWMDREVNAAPQVSDITDDSSPFEFSVAFEDGQPELRMLTEAQGTDGSQGASWEAARAVNRDIEHRFGASLRRLRKVEHLFTPNEDAVFGLWHAVCLRPGKAPSFKVYLNPQAQGEASSLPLTTQALSTLGMTNAIRWLHETGLSTEDDRLIYFSLDLADHDEVRTKIYIAHPNASAEDLEPIMASAPGHVPGDAVRFCEAACGRTSNFGDRPLLTCAAFVGGRPQPATVTLHVPVRCYVENDEIALRRLNSILPEVSALPYERMLRTMSSRDLSQGSGMQTYFSYRRSRRGNERVTIYISPELYRTHT